MAVSAGSFSGHETFPFRYAWMKKGVDAVEANPKVFASDDAMSDLGVGKNMVRSIRHWCLAAGLIEEKSTAGDRNKRLTVSQLGRSVFSDSGLDPYLEDPATLWLLHWQLASAPDHATTWFWAFSHVHDLEFSKESLLDLLRSWINANNLKQVSDGTLERDVDCFLRTYTRSRGGHGSLNEDTLDCPLVDLEIISASSDHATYAFARGAHDSLPDGVVFFAVRSFWERFAPTRESLSLQELAHQPGSPGRVLKLDESSLAERLESFERLTKGSVVYDETAGLKQLYRKKKTSPKDALDLVYRCSSATATC